MKTLNRGGHPRRLLFLGVAAASLFALAGVFWEGAAFAARNRARPGAPGVPYANMPAVAPIGVRVDKYLDVPELAKGPPVDVANGYRTQKLGAGLYMITDGAYQSMFLTYEDGVVVIDAPSYASHIPEAIAQVTDEPITHLVYSHYHADHIAGAKSLGGHPVIVAQKETNRPRVTNGVGSTRRVRPNAIGRLVSRWGYSPRWTTAQWSSSRNRVTWWSCIAMGFPKRPMRRPRSSDGTASWRWRADSIGHQ